MRKRKAFVTRGMSSGTCGGCLLRGLKTKTGKDDEGGDEEGRDGASSLPHLGESGEACRHVRHLRADYRVSTSVFEMEIVRLPDVEQVSGIPNPFCRFAAVPRSCRDQSEDRIQEARIAFRGHTASVRGGANGRVVVDPKNMLAMSE